MSADKPTRGSKSQSRSDFRRLQRRFMGGLLRSLFFINSSTRHSRAGFVLPTTVLLLLVMTLTVGALSFRSFSRTQSVSMAREQQVIDNIAAPAVDRAKAKLEYLFTRDTRLPGVGTPSSDTLATLMLNEDSTGIGKLGITKLGRDPYTLPDEKRLNINANAINTNINNISGGTVDNAWSFGFDLNGDGTIQQGETIAYSVLMDDAVEAGLPNNRADDIKIEDTGAAANVIKANNLVTRNGPVDTAASLANCGGSREPQQGWLAVNAATLEKNFQITVFVSNNKGTGPGTAQSMGRANSALEFQQVRRALQGNRWGAWFKYDMEIHPGPDFNWNGAIHTDGNMLVTNNLQAHMISSHKSCLYGQQASAITMAQNDNDGDGIININNKDFQGQLIAGAPSYGDMGNRGTPRLHIFTNLTTKPKIDDGDTKLTSSNDSVQGNSYSDLLLIALDPVELFTKNVSRHRGTGWQRATNWANNAYAKGGRVINQTLAAPYLDDFYRADNRYGPRPSYDKTNWVKATDDPVINTTRSSPSYDKQTGDEILPTDESGDNLINTAAGLDGYWERQAIGRGMRVVVGQRLELGNSLGWNFNPGISPPTPPRDPLYPSDLNNMANKQKQRVTLRDNLAAVQGMVVYQYESSNGNFPLACIANTAHPGTLQTLVNSRTFSEYESGTPKLVKTDFLAGEGTNGWEFSFPSAFDTNDKFGSELARDKPLGIALRNLAYFAGDPKGGSPSFTPVQDTTVHPLPQQAMWGDYSILRRIFDDQLDNSLGWRSATNPPQRTTMLSRYNDLSPADQSSLHSAACTLGLFAYNLKSVETEYERFTVGTDVVPAGAAGTNSVGAQFSKLMDGIVTTASPEIGGNATNNLCAGGLGAPACPPTTYDPNYYAQFTTEQWINALNNSGLITSTANRDRGIKRARLMVQRYQIQRDRNLGFLPSTASTINYVYPGSEPNIAGQTFQVGCDPATFADPNFSERARLGLLSALCPISATAKYPSLYYLFPAAEHNQVGSGTPSPQPSTEEYINQPYLFSNSDAMIGVNKSASVTYKVVDASAISFEPRLVNLSNWSLPKAVLSSSAALNPESMNIKLPNDRLASLSLLDKVAYNGREEMAVRVLDIDLGRLTKTRTGGSSGDYWISDGQDTTSGIFYAAREDALREDAIVRPASIVAGATTTWSDCNTLTKLLGSNSNETARRCWMRPTRPVASGGPTDGGPTDPPLGRREDGSLTGISVKPVDFAPDPDRRPHGFRLNANLDGNNGDLSNANGRTWGLTFVTDNAAYIKGQFNPHTSNGTNTLEEFKETLFDGAVGFGAPFYDNRTNLNTDIFATKTGDRWRVAEVLADAVYIVSNNFVDGAVQEGFIRNRNQVSTDFKNIANSNSKTSFHNQQRPLDDSHNAWGGATSWLRVDGSYSNTAVPIWVGNNGESKLSDGTVFNNANDDNRFELPDERHQDALIVPPATERINATIIAGLIPSRNQQSYGGLHNFPRFLEDWSNKNLFIQGAFLQLNFSTTGTGPFDIDAWQPDETPISAERINYYRPPNRRWGYDVGLQYTPAGPIAQRFVQVDRPRSEHYRELSIEDPYVANLRCSKLASGTRQFPGESSCP